MAGMVKNRAQMLSASVLVLASLTFTSAVAEDNSSSFTSNEGTTTTLTSREDGTDVIVQDARGVSTHYRFNVLGQLQSEEAPEQGISSYKYDEQGRPLQVELEDGISSTLSFDDRNRVTRQLWREGFNERITTRYSYDGCENGEGRLCRVNHDGHITRYGYLPDGKLAFTKAKLADEDAVETIRYRYRADGSLQSMRYPSGLRVTYGYDDQGRVASLLGAFETGDDRARFTIL